MNDCPQSLLKLQSWFAKIITAPLGKTDQANLPIYTMDLIDEIRRQIEPSPHLKSEERIGIYHQQYWWRLISIIQEIYPSLVRLFDYKDFNRLIAEPYLLKFPPEDWFLSRIGSHLPEWVEKNYKGKDLSLVLGLAQLDLAYEELLFTEILSRINSHQIHRCETETMFLQPFVRLFELDFDFFTFRSKLLKQPSDFWQTNDLPRIKKEKAHFVLFRKKERNFYEKISEPRFALLQRFKEGAKLADLTDLLVACDDVVEWFKIISSRGWLSFSKNC